MTRKLDPLFSNLFILAAIWGPALFICLVLPNSLLILPAAACVTGLFLFSCFRPAAFGKAAAFCFRYRWALALCFFLTCVALRLNGSSINRFAAYFGDEETEHTLFGVSRVLRSDEWAVQTPTFFSQFYNGFRLFNERKSLTPLNTVMDYYAPARDVTAVGKPLNWGYLLFGNAVGLSWYWCGQLTLLFMLSLEMLRILTRDDRGISVLGAVMLTFSPFIQWWFLPHIPIVILYATGLFVIGWHFFTAETKRKRILLSAAAVVAATGFALSIFPAIQVPCLYADGILLAVSLYRDRKMIRFTAKDAWLIAAPLALTVLILGHFYATSKDALEAVLHSVYPGQRSACLGGTYSVSHLFTSLVSLFLPFKAPNYLNSCEISEYIHFAPFFAALLPRMLIRLKKEGKSIAVGLGLFICTLIPAWFMVIGVPEWLAEITLLRYCTRMHGIYGWCGTLFTLWGLSVLLQYPDLLKKWQKTVYPALYALVSFLLTEQVFLDYLYSIPALHGRGRSVVCLLLAGVALLLILAAYGNRKTVTALLLCVMMICGGTVNPVEQGISVLTEHPVYGTAAKIAAEDPDSLWLAADVEWTAANGLVAVGARAVNATNFYMDREKWRILDPEGLYPELENRYANILCLLENGEVKLSLLNPDLIGLTLTPKALKDLNVRYLLSGADPAELLQTEGISCEKLMTHGFVGIYKLTY